MVQKCRGFTLIEILIAVTLSAILFTGMTMFVTQGIQVTTRTGIVLREGGDSEEVYKKLETLSRYPVEEIWTGMLTNGTGTLLRSENEYYFVGARTATGYCEDSPNEEHEFLEIINGPGLWSTETQTSWVYSISDDGLAVFSGTTQVIGSGVQGSSIDTPLTTELGGGTSLAVVGGSVWLADPRNNRVLVYSGAVNGIDSLSLWSYGILAPQSLLSESSTSLLVGARNGLFRIQDTVATGETLEATFTGITASFTGARVTFEGITAALTGPTNTDFDILVNGVSVKNGDDPPVVLGSASVEYTFSGTTVNLIPASSLTLSISNIAPLPATSWQYSAVIELLDSTGVVYETRVPYVTIGDGNLATLSNNSIEQLSSESGVAGVQNLGTYKKFPWDHEEFLSHSGNTVLQSSAPIDSFVWSMNSGVLTISYREYQIYDCREGNHRSQDRVLKFRLE